VDAIVPNLEKPIYGQLEKGLTESTSFMFWTYKKRPDRSVHFVRIAEGKDFAVIFNNPSTSSLL